MLFFAALASTGAEPLTISTSYQNLLSNRDATGILDRVLSEVFARMGVDIEIVFSSTASSLEDVNAGVLDAEINRIAGMEESYPDLVRVSEPNMTMRFVAFAKREIPINGWESIRELDIGIVRGWKILEQNTEGFPNTVLVPTENELFSMLRLGRIDVALYSELTGLACVSELELDGIMPLEPPLETREMYLYLHRGRAYLADEIAQTLREVKADGTYASIRAQVLDEYGIESW